ncbi:MAG: tetratricopeptide repeat protein [Bacteroidetes bacterium]|nr:tetratricopeptide repeat protein [Bacteroidota bacterium]
MLTQKGLVNKEQNKALTMKISSDRYLPHLLIFLFAFVLYGNTLTHDYALDDMIVITDNTFTKKGLSGIKEIFSYDSFTGFFGVEKKLVAGGRYRPLSIASFAVEYALMGGQNPFFSHLINILLYALTGSFIFILFSRLVKPPPGKSSYLNIPFFATMLFLAHPIHTEVVANIKGRDEILALLFPLAALSLTIRYFNTRKAVFLFLANLCFFLGLLSKENAITFIIIIPLTVFFFLKVPLKKNLMTGVSFLFTALIFVFIRFLVLGYINSGELPKELLNNPFLEATQGQKFGTIIYTLGLYVKLLLFPHPLTHDYYPYHIPLISMADWRALISFAVYVMMIIYSVVKFKSKDMIAYGILFYLLTLFIVSNLLFSVGTFMNERFIYMPSLGFVIIIACLIIDKLPSIIKNVGTYKKFATGVFLVTLFLLTLLTYSRNKAWKDNFSLFTTDVKVSENSIKCNVSAGGDYIKKAGLETDTAKQAEYYQSAIMHLEKAINIYPKAINGLVLYGNVLTLYKKDYKEALRQYLTALEYSPFDKNAYSNTLQVLGSLDSKQETEYKINVLRRLNSINPNNPDVNYNLGKLYGQFKGNLDSSCFFLERSINLSSGNLAAYKDLGIVYSMQGEYAKAMDVFSKAEKLDPADQQIRQNILITRQIMNQKRK